MGSVQPYFRYLGLINPAVTLHQCLWRLAVDTRLSTLDISNSTTAAISVDSYIRWWLSSLPENTTVTPSTDELILADMEIYTVYIHILPSVSAGHCFQDSLSPRTSTSSSAPIPYTK